ncbi:uncharacterized protein EHS24_009207 [Apiotrichum porosum]|uniref:Myb-like domain-containing protein n=1 Tax=Apiotrichum porosum TaxID=105984 RepID=A0A427XNZ6_9TREE|nr:uncharacterized protein EHS24_009207 [Apiotrichum porosum]RSH80625.1 hypothetical protein EHS24_009207 [Apiotrichum porosum]
MANSSTPLDGTVIKIEVMTDTSDEELETHPGLQTKQPSDESEPEPTPPPKRKRGRPRKEPSVEVKLEIDEDPIVTPKRRRGRPPKAAVVQQDTSESAPVPAKRGRGPPRTNPVATAPPATPTSTSTGRASPRKRSGDGHTPSPAKRTRPGRGTEWTADELGRLFAMATKGASLSTFSNFEGRTPNQCYMTWHNTLYRRLLKAAREKNQKKD